MDNKNITCYDVSVKINISNKGSGMCAVIQKNDRKVEI